MSDERKAVFLSYASQDADAAKRICESLRQAGVEVWFDQSELVGGDAWDAKIRGQIASCALFVPVISANTQARREGYFRLEWKLAAQRTHMISERAAFLLPVVIDVTRDADADVPAEFRAVQWTRLVSGEARPAFVARVTNLLAGPSVKTAAGAPAMSAPSASTPPWKSSVPHWAAAALVASVLGLGGYIALRPATKEMASATPRKPLAETRPAPSPAAQPPLDFASAVGSAKADVKSKSIAVLPFANLSPDPDNAFFADGIHEDVITTLAKIRDLQVISRTSTLAYRDAAQRNLRKIAEELGVAAVLEGSVRRAGGKVRVTAQLIDARTDKHLWAETYDRDLSDIFAVQAALAQEIAGALKATLTPNERALIERAMTTSPDAYDLYLRAEHLRHSLGISRSTREQWELVVKLYEEAVAKDPAFAMAHVQLATVHGQLYRFPNLDASPARMALARQATEAAERIAPGSPEASYARGVFAYFVENNWQSALVALRSAESGLPNVSRLKFMLGLANQRLGQWSEARRYFERAFTLDPKGDHTTYLQTSGRCSVSPNEIRADPVWSRLKADARFEEILKAAKPL